MGESALPKSPSYTAHTQRSTLLPYTHNVLTRNRNAGAQFLFLARVVQLKGELRLWSGYSYVKQKLHAKYMPNEL